jgi:uncharacterized membrane protein YeaQ/YmgE (transglycosylase-associated protein family)
MNDLSGAEWSLVCLLAVVASLATGFVIDVIAQRAAFGTFINAVLALAGACGGIYLRYHWLGSSRIDDILLTISSALAGAFVLIFTLAYLRSRVL